MAFCSQCGANVPENVAFCPKCGRAQSAASPAAGTPSPSPMAVDPPAAGTTGMQENVAGMLCYSLGWLTGLIFFFLDKRPFVRWHAAQSIVTFGGLHIIMMVLDMFAAGSLFTSPWGWGHWGAFFLIHRLVDILALILWIVCMVRAYKGERFKLPLAGDIAESLAK
jgi:uncharacterized membrane protein